MCWMASRLTWSKETVRLILLAEVEGRREGILGEGGATAAASGPAAVAAEAAVSWRSEAMASASESEYNFVFLRRYSGTGWRTSWVVGSVLNHIRAVVGSRATGGV